MSDPNKYADFQSRVNLMDDPWLLSETGQRRAGYVAPDGPPPEPEFHAERVRITLEVNVPVMDVNRNGTSEVEQLVHELNQVARQHDTVTLVVNGYGMDFRVDRAQAERTER